MGEVIDAENRFRPSVTLDLASGPELLSVTVIVDASRRITAHKLAEIFIEQFNFPEDSEENV